MKSNHKGWRLVHNGKSVVALIDATTSGSETVSQHTIEEFHSREEAEARIFELGLEVKELL